MQVPEKVTEFMKVDRSVEADIRTGRRLNDTAQAFVNEIYLEMLGDPNDPSDNEYHHVLHFFNRIAHIVYESEEDPAHRLGHHRGFMMGQVLGLHARELIVGKGAIKDVYEALRAMHHDAQGFANGMVPLGQRERADLIDRPQQLSRSLLQRVRGDKARKIQFEDESLAIADLAAELAPNDPRQQLEIQEGYRFIRHARKVQYDIDRMAEPEVLSESAEVRLQFDELFDEDAKDRFADKILESREPTRSVLVDRFNETADTFMDVDLSNRDEVEATCEILTDAMKTEFERMPDLNFFDDIVIDSPQLIYLQYTGGTGIDNMMTFGDKGQLRGVLVDMSVQRILNKKGHDRITQPDGKDESENFYAKSKFRKLGLVLHIADASFVVPGHSEVLYYPKECTMMVAVEYPGTTLFRAVD